MVTQVIETGATPSPPRNNTKSFWSKAAYVVGLGCCMHERKSRAERATSTNTLTPETTAAPATAGTRLDEIKAGDVNWSTSTLGMETDLTMRPEAIRSDASVDSDARELPMPLPPLSSFEFYAPRAPAAVARPQSRTARRDSRRTTSTTTTTRSGTESPVITITDYDIATGGRQRSSNDDGTTTPSTGETQREREARGTKKSKKTKSKSRVKTERKSSSDSASTLQAWSRIDPMYDIYLQDRDNRWQAPSSTRQQSTNSQEGRFTNIRAFDFMSYGGWIVI